MSTQQDMERAAQKISGTSSNAGCIGYPANMKQPKVSAGCQSFDQYLQSEMDSLYKQIGYAVMTEQGLAILRNFDYNPEKQRITGAIVEFDHGIMSLKFGQVWVPTLMDRIADVLKKHSGLTFDDQMVAGSLISHALNKLIEAKENGKREATEAYSHEHIEGSNRIIALEKMIEGMVSNHAQQVKSLDEQIEKVRQDNFRLNKELNHHRATSPLPQSNG